MKSVFRDDILEGKVALVTGGGSGICKGIAQALLAHGARCAIVGRKAERLAGAAAELSATTGRECIALPADVRDTAAIEKVVDSTLERFGRIDVLVNGAAGNFLAPAAQLSYNGFKTVMEIDAIGTFNVTKATFEKRLRDHGGNVINISATLHLGGTPLQVHAASAKAAIDAMTRTLAIEWGPLGIRVNAIAPGPIDETEGMKRLAPGGVKDRMTAAIPLGRFGRIDEMASIALFLASDASSYIHGEVIVADGGAWLPTVSPLAFAG
ncbi:MAG: SDR family oxidoreductase [Deltaproteobacteria bacterium]|nr:SDR family oxidoreductase [Deltaproteobacteria bacterium]